MQQVLLVEDRLRPIPESIKVIKDWDAITVQTSATSVVRGDHMLLEGSPEDFKGWLKPFDGVWVGVSAPQLQQFQVMHIK